MIDYTKIEALLKYDELSPMIFSSGFFLWLFLGFTFIYMLLGKTTTLRLLFVTAFSYFFYYKSSGEYFYLLAIVTFSDFIIAAAINKINARNTIVEEGTQKIKHSALARFLLIISLLVDL